jgi:hypothetical protein
MRTSTPQQREIPLGSLPWSLVDTAGAVWRWEGKRLTLLVDDMTIAVVDLERRMLLIDMPAQTTPLPRSEKHG